MSRRNFYYRSKWGLGFLLLALLSPAFIAGCSMVDQPSTTPPPETDVRNYYTAVAATGVHYQYAITASAPYYPSQGTLSMDMQGANGTQNSMPVYACLWSYQNWGTPAVWYYGLNQQQAVDFGVELKPGMYADSWVDLQAPLHDTAMWNFTSQGEHITAVVTKYGVSAEVNGKNYDNVLMVQFTGDAGTTGTEWFAKGTGLIFSHVTRSNGTVESQLQSVVQK